MARRRCEAKRGVSAAPPAPGSNPLSPRSLTAVTTSTTPTWPVAAGALLVGFAVAEITGVRAIGGVVLFLGALWCGLHWKARRGLPLALALVVLFLVLFAISHVLGDQIGAWPSVFVVAAVMGVTTWIAADRRTPPDVIDVV